MRVRMDIVSGAKTKQLVLRLPSVIGRGGTAKIKLAASTVSRHHCELYEFEGQIAVRDLGSSNGTIVNGHPIQAPTFLTPEDELSIGPIKARLSTVADDDVVAAEKQAASAAHDLSDLDQLPAENSAPVAPKTPRDLDAPVGTVGGAPTDESVLQYSESNDAEHSFVEISTNPESAVDVKIPVFDDEKPKSNVADDDSALNDFFKNLD